MATRVLIFEDDEILRSTLKVILEEFGYEVFTFSNPGLCPVYDSTDHKCTLDHACADIIISDVDMPIKSSLELIKDLKQKGCKIEYPSLISGDWSDSSLKYAQELGCRALHKSFDFEELLQWLDDCSKHITPDRQLSNLFTKIN